MSETCSIRIPNMPADIASALNAALLWLEPLTIPPEARNFVSLDAGKLILRATDDGIPFDPMSAPEPSTRHPVADRSPGGLGILLLRKMADHMSYECSGGLNTLTLEKSSL
ncbi:MAG: ATP-binding protein [bacterium]